ncbi:MAG TPA: NAD(P)H-dependent oxidoreductase subunit E, partial [Xanthomonadales bacterium]|nr:NAD(P)H-dependent oxidoreductase subunit E [Xanthomonadales bacterium]
MNDIARIVGSALENNKNRLGALMPILHELQNSLGHIPAEAVPMVAEGLNLSRAEVHGVIGFYHDFHTEPRGDNLVQLC